MDDLQAILERIRNNDSSLTAVFLNYKIDDEVANDLAEALKKHKSRKS